VNNIVLDDNYIDQHSSWEIVAPLVQNVSIYDGPDTYLKDLTKFSKQQQYVFAIDWYQSEVDNGGHKQFFFNATGIVFQEALDGLQAIGAYEFYKIMKEATVRMGNGLSKDCSTRRFFLEDERPNFDDLDTKFYTLNKDAPLETLLKTHILKNKEKFYSTGN